MSRFLNSKYTGLEAYTPGEQPRDLDRFIKLNTNESPFPPSSGVVGVLSRKEAEDLRLYCDPECTILSQELAGLYSVSREQVFLSNGSDDILNFAFMIFSESPEGGNAAAYPEISYGFYKVFAQLHGIAAQQIALQEDFSLNYKDFCGLNKMIVIANPNAPTGTTLELWEIEEILKSNPDNVVIIDEAYVDFGAESAVKLVPKYNNLLVVQTFSKSRSMAGARLGFAIGCRELIADLNLIKYSTNPYNVNRLTQAAGIMALRENDYYMDNAKKIQDIRRYTVDELEKLGFTVIPSKANFIFAKNDEIDGEILYNRLKDRKILVRHFTNEKICQYNRITIGTLEQMKAFIEATAQILKER